MGGYLSAELQRVAGHGVAGSTSAIVATCCDVMPDGRMFLMVNFVLDWFRSVERRCRESR